MTELKGKFDSQSEENMKSEKNECYQTLFTERKKRMELIENWHQSYYLWNSTYMAYFLMNSSIVSYAPNQRPAIPRTLLDSTYDQVNPNTHQNPTNNQYNHHHHHHHHPAEQINPQNINQNVNNNNRHINPHLAIYKIPTLFTRLMAEVFDALYIQLIKIFIAIVLVNYTDLFDESFKIFDLLEAFLNEDNVENIRLPMELLFLELIYVMTSVFFEAFCIYTKGYTPGKYMFNLKIISCNFITELPNNTIRVVPGTKLSFKSILIRTCLKNFSIVFLFPTILFFILPAFTDHGQTSYDKASESIVVQSD